MGLSLVSSSSPSRASTWTSSIVENNHLRQPNVSKGKNREGGIHEQCGRTASKLLGSGVRYAIHGAGLAVRGTKIRPGVVLYRDRGNGAGSTMKQATSDGQTLMWPEHSATCHCRKY